MREGVWLCQLLSRLCECSLVVWISVMWWQVRTPLRYTPGRRLSMAWLAQGWQGMLNFSKSPFKTETRLELLGSFGTLLVPKALLEVPHWLILSKTLS